MKLATLRAEDGTRAVRVDEGVFVDLEVADVGVLLAEPNWRERAEAATKRWDPQTVRYATLVPHPSKVWCTGLNYRNHIAEVGRPTPDYPTLFVKFAESLIGAYDEIVRPPESAKLDWEGELTIVIGARVRRASEDEARAAIAGFTVMNDISCRDWQSRTLQWDQGKAWEALTPVGPVLVTPDELPGGYAPELRLTTEVDGETMQDDVTSDLVFDPVALVQYASTIVTLNPGDLIATGTPGGVGLARTPQVFLEPGQTVSVSIEGIGAVENRIVAG